MNNVCTRPNSQSSLSTNSSTRSVWSRFSGLINRRRRRTSSQRRESYHSSTFSTETPTATSTTPSSSSDNNSDFDLTSSSGSIRSASKPKRYSTPVQLRHHRQQQQKDESFPPFFAIPPYSPTYCKDNEFPYSNFYVRLPNGDYMVRYRSGNRDILGTEIIAGYMI